MLRLIRSLLLQHIDNIDSGNTNINYEQLCLILKAMSNIQLPNEEFCKIEAAEYVNLSVSTFEKRIEQGLIPKGKKVGKFKECRWYKSDLDLYLINEL